MPSRESYIHKFEEIEPNKPNGKTIFYMQGYGGRKWQVNKQLKILSKAGYRIYFFDFYDVFKSGNHHALINLVDEVDSLVKAKIIDPETTTFIGISLGGLIGYNLLKRHNSYKKLIIITGGDITHVPSMIHLRRKWSASKQELDDLWKSVNIYLGVGKLQNKNIVMILPKKDKIIDPQEVIDEINRHQKLNNIILIRTQGGHWRTIMSETIGHPKRTLEYIQKVNI